jgi:hypothetical protein
MRTCVRVYVIYKPTEPHIALDFAETLDGIATLLAARRGPELTVGANQSGHTRPLNEVEQEEVAERVRELRALSGEAA